jgi:hypothetical protein
MRNFVLLFHRKATSVQLPPASGDWWKELHVHASTATSWTLEVTELLVHFSSWLAEFK